mgnify:CR=1 FL=1
MASGQGGCFIGSHTAAKAGGEDRQQDGKTLERHMPEDTGESGKLGWKTITLDGREKLDLRRKRRCDAAEIPNKK